MRTVRTDRSRIESYQRCNRLRYLEYHAEGTGVVAAKKSLPLCVGGAVHSGLAILLELGQAGYTLNPLLFDSHPHNLGALRTIEEEAVESALEDFAQHRGTLALDTAEAAGQQANAPIVDDVMRQQLADSLGLSVEDAGLAQLQQQAGEGAREFDDYLWQEQSSLVEALVRAYARRRLRPLLEQYEVLEVEREGEWTLSEWEEDTGSSCLVCGHAHNRHGADGKCWDCRCVDFKHMEDVEIKFMSRPDALLRDRADNSLYILSFKTAASWDIRKARDAQHDMQGLSEGVEVERRLGEWWEAIQEAKGKFEHASLWEDMGRKLDANTDTKYASRAMFEFLFHLPAPPRILGIRYEYMLKSYRGKDRDLSSRVGFEAWTQRSHLIRAYQSNKNPSDLNIGWEFLKDTGEESKLAWQSWKSRFIGDLGLSVKQWIDLLDDSTESMSAYDSTTGMEPRSIGWKSAAQTTGFLVQHPLDSIFIPPIMIFRGEDDLRDLVEQMEAQEVRIAEAVAQVDAATDDDNRRHLLNVNFPQTRRSCEYPSTCPFVPICYGGEDIRRNPLDSGKYVVRIPNHVMEVSNHAKKVHATGMGTKVLGASEQD